MYQPFDEEVEVLGSSMLSVISSLPAIPFLVEKYFKESGLPLSTDIDPDGWYLQKKWLNVFKVIADKAGSNTILNIGKKIPENAKFPENLSSIEEALQSIDIAYHMNHRKDGKILYDSGILLEGIGHYTYQKLSKNKIIMVCNNPYPCDFDRGIISALTLKFKPEALILHDDAKECRKTGADSCTYIITW